VNERCELGKGASEKLHAHQRKDDEEEKEEREVARLKNRGGDGRCTKRNRLHTQTHNKNNTIHDTTRTTPQTTT